MGELKSLSNQSYFHNSVILWLASVLTFTVVSLISFGPVL